MSAIAFTNGEVSPVSSSTVIMDGGMQFWAGLSFGAASFINYLVLSGVIQLPHPGMIGIVWMGATAAFILFGVILKVGTDRALLTDPGFRRYRALWGSLILGAAFLVAALIILMIQFGQGQNASFVTSPVSMAIYGIGWRLTAVLSGRKWPNLLAVAALICSPFLATLAGTPQQSLAYTVCLTGIAVLPGLFLLMRRNPA